MRVLLSSICSLLLLGSAQAGEIAAWKVYLSDILDYATVERSMLSTIEDPPEQSVFFNEGDTLFQFSETQIKALLPTQPALEWAVWNETTGRLVTKSDWNGFIQLHVLIPQDPMVQLRTTFSCLPIEDVARPADINSKPLQQFTVLSRSGEQAEINWKQGELSTNLMLEAIASEDAGMAHIRICATSVCDKDIRINLNTATNTRTGESQWIARDHDGKKGYDFVIQSQAELLDGTPINEFAQIQRDGKAHSLRPGSIHRYKIEKLDDTQWLMTTGMSAEVIHKLFEPSNHAADQGNPFDAADPMFDAPGSKKVIPLGLKTVQAPGILKERFPNPVLDLGKIFKKSGIVLNEDDLIGYDPLAQLLFFYTDRHEEIDKIEHLLSPGMRCGLPAVTFTTWEQGGAQSCIIARSGEVASITRLSKDGPTLRVFEVEPVVGEFDHLASLRIRAEDNTREDHAFLLKGAYTFQLGTWKTVSEASGPAGKQSSRIKMELIDIHAH